MSHEIWQRIFDAVDDPIFLHDTEFRLLLANPAYFQAAGMAEAEAIGKPYWEVFPRDSGPLPGCKHALNEGRAESQEEIMAGERIFISRGYAVRDEQGKVCYSLHILSDITEQTKAKLHFIRLNRMYRTISRCNQVLVRTGDELELAHEMCRVLVEEGGFCAAWVGYAETSGAKCIRPTAAVGIDPGEIEAMKLTWEDNEVGHGPMASAIRTGEIVASRDILIDPRWAHWNEPARRLGFSTATAIPLRVNGFVLGGLEIFAAEADAFAPDMLELLAELAGDLAFGIGNLRSRAERLGILEKLELSLDHAVTAIAATVEMRDPYTAGHQRRVAKLAAAIATEMGLPDDQVQGLHMACVVHDIGKIHVPAEILSSPAKLSEAEFAIIKTHPQAGWEILKGIDFPWPVAEIVYQHHEKLDGSGYPRGLKGDEILLEARILMVADVVEAMTSHRPYRPGFGIFPALQEISRNKGKLYDATTVEACMRVFMEKDYEWEAKVSHTKNLGQQSVPVK
jgi:PAS domain S-box-containing protein/putative nucleotidyltransferase with HDIG domain